MIELEVNKVPEHKPLPCATRKGLDSDDERLVLLVKLALALSRSN